MPATPFSTIELDGAVDAGGIELAGVGKRRHGDDIDPCGRFIQQVGHEAPPFLTGDRLQPTRFQPSPATDVVFFHGTINRSSHSMMTKKIMPMAEIMTMAANCRAMLKLDPATWMT